MSEKDLSTKSQKKRIGEYVSVTCKKPSHRKLNWGSTADGTCCGDVLHFYQHGENDAYGECAKDLNC